MGINPALDRLIYAQVGASIMVQRGKKTASSKRKSQPHKHIPLKQRLRSPMTWLLLVAVLIVALALQQFGVVTLAIDEDLFPSCTQHEHCQVGKNCIFGKCFAHTPDYPEIGKVKVKFSTGADLLPDNQGFYPVPSHELMFLEVQADNRQNQFTIEVYSPIGLGQGGLDANRRLYFNAINPGDAQYKNLYWVQVPEQAKDYRHRFYFELLGFEGEKFNLFVYLKNGSTTSEFVELPIKII